MEFILLVCIIHTITNQAGGVEQTSVDVVQPEPVAAPELLVPYSSDRVLTVTTILVGSVIFLSSKL